MGIYKWEKEKIKENYLFLRIFFIKIYRHYKKLANINKI